MPTYLRAPSLNSMTSPWALSCSTQGVALETADAATNATSDTRDKVSAVQARGAPDKDLLVEVLCADIDVLAALPGYLEPADIPVFHHSLKHLVDPLSTDAEPLA